MGNSKIMPWLFSWGTAMIAIVSAFYTGINAIFFFSDMGWGKEHGWISLVVGFVVFALSALAAIGSREIEIRKLKSKKPHIVFEQAETTKQFSVKTAIEKKGGSAFTSTGVLDIPDSLVQQKHSYAILHYRNKPMNFCREAESENLQARIAYKDSDGKIIKEVEKARWWKKNDNLYTGTRKDEEYYCKVNLPPGDSIRLVIGYLSENTRALYSFSWETIDDVLDKEKYFLGVKPVIVEITMFAENLTPTKPDKYQMEIKDGQLVISEKR